MFSTFMSILVITLFIDNLPNTLKQLSVLTALLKISLPNTQLILPTAISKAIPLTTISKAILSTAQQSQTKPKSIECVRYMRPSTLLNPWLVNKVGQQQKNKENCHIFYDKNLCSTCPENWGSCLISFLHFNCLVAIHNQPPSESTRFHTGRRKIAMNTGVARNHWKIRKGP